MGLHKKFQSITEIECIIKYHTLHRNSNHGKRKFFGSCQEAGQKAALKRDPPKMTKIHSCGPNKSVN